MPVTENRANNFHARIQYDRNMTGEQAQALELAQKILRDLMSEFRAQDLAEKSKVPK